MVDEVTIDVDAWQGAACVGTVIAGELIGKRVIAGTADACGECDVCRRGGATVCPQRKPRVIGKRTTAASRWLVPLVDGLEALPSPAAAAIAGDVALAYTMYARTNIAPHDPVVIAGTTPVSRFLVEILRAKAITPVVIAEAPAWCAWLASKGAVVVAGATRELVTAAIAAQGTTTRPWRIIATDPRDPPFHLAGPRSSLTLLPVAALPPALVADEVTLVPVAREHSDLIVEVAAICAKGDVDLAGGTTLDGDDPTRSRLAIPTTS